MNYSGRLRMTSRELAAYDISIISTLTRHPTIYHLSYNL